MRNSVELVYEHPNRYREVFRMSKKDFNVFAGSAPEGLERILVRNNENEVISLNFSEYVSFCREVTRQDLVTRKNKEGVLCVLYPNFNEREFKSAKRKNLEYASVLNNQIGDDCIDEVLENDSAANLSDTRLAIKISRELLNRTCRLDPACEDEEEPAYKTSEN